MGQEGRVIAIDGPAGSGKSTVSRLLAQKMGYCYLDTGAMYRAFAWLCLRCNLEESAEEEAVAEVLNHFQIEMTPSQVFVNQIDVTEAIRSMEVSQSVSRFSAWPVVRKVMVAKQRDLAKGRNVVMEGRDIGSVVFPETPFKFYLDASVEERARRRALELSSKKENISEADVQKAICERDKKDAERAHSPLICLPDAHKINTTGLSIEDVVAELVRQIKEMESK